MKRGAVALLLMAVLASVGTPVEGAGAEESRDKSASYELLSQPTPTPTRATPSPGGRPSGARDPLVGALAVIAILVAGGAGLWVYRVIRKGL